jgi:hypothetical protein
MYMNSIWEFDFQFNLHAMLFNIFIQMKLNFHTNNFFFHHFIVICNAQQPKAEVYNSHIESWHINMSVWTKESMYQSHVP